MKGDLARLVSVGKRAFGEKDFRRAEKMLREALEEGANYPDLHYTLGLIYHQWGKLEKAAGHFENSVTLNPQYTEALLALAITLNDLGRYEDAKASHQRAGSSLMQPGKIAGGSLFGGKIANLHAELGELYLALGKNEEAIAEYRKALRLAPGFADLRVRLAVALRETGRLQEGLAEVERALADHPGLFPALTQRGILHYLLGRKDEARRSWEEALFRDPLNKLVQLYLNTLDRDDG